MIEDLTTIGLLASSKCGIATLGRGNIAVVMRYNRKTALAVFLKIANFVTDNCSHTPWIEGVFANILFIQVVIG
jgi:hypothetical protein